MTSLDALSKKTKSLDRKIKSLERLRDSITIEMRKVAKLSFLSCTECNKKSRISSWIFVQVMWWVPPSGCNEGGYWADHNAETCDIRCPYCDCDIYIYNYPHKKKILALLKYCPAENLFKEVVSSERS